MNKHDVLRKLQAIPGVDEDVANELYTLGFRSISDLSGKDPERMFRELALLQKKQVDRSRLAIFRCAVYFASTPYPEPEKLKWWNWKD